jgi:hypothetical protein
VQRRLQLSYDRVPLLLQHGGGATGWCRDTAHGGSSRGAAGSRTAATGERGAWFATVAGERASHSAAAECDAGCTVAGRCGGGYEDGGGILLDHAYNVALPEGEGAGYRQRAHGGALLHRDRVQADLLARAARRHLQHDGFGRRDQRAGAMADVCRLCCSARYKASHLRSGVGRGQWALIQMGGVRCSTVRSLVVGGVTAPLHAARGSFWEALRVLAFRTWRRTPFTSPPTPQWPNISVCD